MSQSAGTRKTMTVSEDKEKRTDSPAKDLKKKGAANVEKEKQTEKPEQKDKTVEAQDKVETNGEKSGKGDKPEDKQKKTETPKQNGSDGKIRNGVSDVTLSQNGAKSEDVVNGTVSEGSDGDDEQNLVIDDDELFPELAYDDSSDVECFEPPTPDSAASRSFTRRSQAKAGRTPETPRPASDKPAEKDAHTDESKDKLIKMKEDAPSANRSLRSTHSPKPQAKKEPTKVLETPKKREKSSTPKPQEKEGKEKKQSEEKAVKEKRQIEETDVKENGDKTPEPIEDIVEVEGSQEELRKTDTNFSKSRVKVSPYRRSIRLADQTNTSTMANYTGNNTTMEMDLTANSSIVSEDPNLDDSSFLKDIKAIRGRRAFKCVKDLTLKYANKERYNTSITTVSSEHTSRPTGTVVGRKRKPDSEDIELGVPAEESLSMKRMRLLDRLPFRWTLASTPIARRSPEIVGVNSDLPLSAPVVVDAESIKSSPIAPDVPPSTHVPERDSKRCVVM